MRSRVVKFFAVLVLMITAAVMSGCDSHNVLGTGGSISGSGK